MPGREESASHRRTGTAACLVVCSPLLYCPYVNGEAQTVVVGQFAYREPVRTSIHYWCIRLLQWERKRPELKGIGGGIPQPYPGAVPVLVIEAVRSEPDSGGAQGFPDSCVPPTLAVFNVATRHTPLAYSRTSRALNQKDLVPVIHDEGKSRSTHLGPRVMDPPASRIFGCPLA